MNADEADAAGQPFDSVLFTTDLQHIPFLQHDVAIQRHLDLRADDAVQETALATEIQLDQILANVVVVLDHDLFGDNLQIQQIPIEHLFAGAIAQIEFFMALRVAEQGNIIPFLDDGIAIRAGRYDAIAAQPLDVTPRVRIDAGLAQSATTDPVSQLGADPVGPNNRQIGLVTIVVG